MSVSIDPKRPSRVRASEVAIKAALKAIQEAGIPVDKVCVNGGSVEIHCGQIDGARAPEKDAGLDEW